MSKKFIVIIKDKTIELGVEQNTILTLLQKNGIIFNAYCGGNGVCKKCKILLNEKLVNACESLPNDGDIVKIVNHYFDFKDTTLKYKVTDTCFLAIDIGTTTIAIALVNKYYEVVESISFVNPQVVYGADVISRIKASQEGNQTQLKDCLISSLNNYIDELLNKHKVEINKIIVSGNTTMMHILLDKDCSSLGHTPFLTKFTKSQKVSSSKIGLNYNCPLITIDCISAFVGGDIVSGLHQLKLPSVNKYNFLIDLGTNAEVALYNKESCFVSSAAAGPCFEGANISQGTSCIDGAISHIDFIDNQFLCETIANIPAIGICGTGLIDAIAIMIKYNFIDEQGTFVNCDNIQLTDKIALTQNDIRQFQLAKSAVSTAIEILMDINNITYDDIEQVYLSGGFSTSLNIQNAVRSGLIPSKLENKCLSINNSSLKGAIKYLNDDKINTGFLDAKYIDLASYSNFSEKFIDNIIFKEV